MIVPKANRDAARARHFAAIMKKCGEHYGDVMQTKSNELMFPIVDEDGHEMFINVLVKVPTGSKGEVYDGYAVAQDYNFQVAEKEKIAAERKAAKDKKIERDKKFREEKAKAKKTGEE